MKVTTGLVLAISGWLALAGGLCSATPLTVVAHFNGELQSESIWRTVDNGANWYQTSTGIFQFNRTGGTYPGFQDSPFYAFCIEPREFVTAGDTYTYNWDTLENGTTNIGGMGTTKANLLRELFARDYPVLGAPLTATEAGAMQIAIWEIVREESGVLNVLTGTTRFGDAQDPGAMTLAQTYLSNLTGSGPRLDNLHALTWVGAQDVIVQTPEPAYAALAGLLLVGCGLWRRRLSGSR